MREIKFRAWDGTNGEMHHNVGVINGKAISCTIYSSSWKIPKKYPTLKEIDDYVASIEDSIILMQYTGLKDVNGVEIYEGDVLLEGAIFKFVVEWGCDGFWRRGLNLHCTGRLGEMKCGVSVIGNAHENPELVEG